MKTYYPTESEVKKEWCVVDLKGKTLGRAATEIACILMGKNKPQYTQAVDVGDFVVALNSDQIKFTGRKLTEKLYYRHTGAIGGIKSVTAQELMQKDSRLVIESAVRGMLPKNKLGRHMLKKLKVYKKGDHDHQAQNPKTVAI